MSIACVEEKRDGVRARLRLKLIEVDGLDLTRTEREAVGWLIRIMIRYGSLEVFLKHEEIAAAAVCSVSTVRRALDKCLAQGFLSWRQRSVAWARGGRRLLSNLYGLVDRAVRTINCSLKKGEQRLRLFRLRLKTEQKEALREETPEEVTPLVFSSRLLTSRIVRRRR